MRSYAKFIDREHARYWAELMTPKGEGVILRKVTTEFKFVGGRPGAGGRE